jgi:hypothetical protein
MMKNRKMESHEHKRQLREIQARRIAYLESKKDNKLIQLHLDRIKKQNDRH